MNSLRQTLQIFLPLTVGIGLLAAIPQIQALVDFEHKLFWTPHLHRKSPTYASPSKKADFEVAILEQSMISVIRQTNTYEVDSTTEDILGTSPLRPANWAYLLSQLSPEKAKVLVITSDLSWEDADEIPIRTLQHELSRFPGSVIGLAAEKTGESDPLPPYLESSVIGEYQGFPADLPEIDFITTPPSVQPTYFGISTVRGFKDKAPHIPLLVRWGNHLLPSVELAALLAEFQIRPSELVIDPAGFIRLNRAGMIYLELDEQGRTKRDWNGSLKSASTLLTGPEQPNAHYFIVPPEAPERFKNLAMNYSKLAQHGQRELTTITRWPLIIEAALLILLVLSFYTKSLWPAFILIAASFATSFVLSKWILATPLLALLIFYVLLFPKRPRRKKYSKITSPPAAEEESPAQA